MTLQIGTILIAKEDFGEFTKGKEYPIVESNNDITYRVICNDEKSVNWFDERRINQHFTIKRYTLTDLQEKKIAVKLRNYAQYKILCEAVGDKNSGVDTYGATDDYFGNDNFNGNSIVFLTRKELEGRTLVPSIDLIDLEVKEDTYTCKYCGAEFSKDVDEEDCYANPNRKPDTPTSSTIVELESEIARLKGDNEMLKSDLGIMVSQFEILQLRESPQISQDLEKRERMAWELFMKYEHMEIDRAFELTDTFLAKSKEVGNGK